MDIYLIELETVPYDSYDGHVIQAANRNRVRQMAMAVSADEGMTVWESAPIHKIGEGPDKNGERIILSSFMAG